MPERGDRQNQWVTEISIHKTGVTKGAAVGYTAWARRVQAHPQVADALAAGEMSESFGRTIGTWTDKLPQECRAAADQILVTAAAAGMGLRDLAGLFGEIYAGTRPTAARPAPGSACCCAPSITRSWSTGGAGPWC